MLDDADLFQFLPSHWIEFLAAAIGRDLVEVERLFLLDQAKFLENKYFTETDFFAYNSGPIQFWFDNNLVHVLDVWGEQLSIVILPDVLHSDEETILYKLTEDRNAPADLRSCLGRNCQDVRIWTLQENFHSEEAKEVAVSYLLSGGVELFYCIYLHEDLDSDYLLLGQNVSRERVATCFSVLNGGFIDPKQ